MVAFPGGDSGCAPSGGHGYPFPLLLRARRLPERGDVPSKPQRYLARRFAKRERMDDRIGDALSSLNAMESVRTRGPFRPEPARHAKTEQELSPSRCAVLNNLGRAL